MNTSAAPQDTFGTNEVVTPVPLPGPRTARRPRQMPRDASLHIIGVGGGKGGIGKSLLSASLGIDLARRGFRVVLLDTDLGGANLHTCLGIEQPRIGLGTFFEDRMARLEDVLQPTGVPNLLLLSGAQDPLDIANPKHHQKLRLLRAVQQVHADYAILDLGSGTTFNVLDFFLAADHGILALVPEPTSVENGYRFLKAAFYRRLKAVEKAYGIAELLQSVNRQPGAASQGPRGLLTEVTLRDAEAGRLLGLQMEQFRPRLVVNMARTPGDFEVGEAVAAAWRKFFGLGMDYLGCIGYDDDVWRCVRSKRPLLIENPTGPTATAVRGIADRLLAMDKR
jgi:flagellar biosynthesis protein FlhG